MSKNVIDRFERNSVEVWTSDQGRSLGMILILNPFTFSKLGDMAFFDILRRWRRFELYECSLVSLLVALR